MNNDDIISRAEAFGADDGIKSARHAARPPDPAKHRFHWSRLVPLALPLGLPPAAWWGGWRAVGLVLAPLLVLLCLPLALTGRWRAVALGASVVVAFMLSL